MSAEAEKLREQVVAAERGQEAAEVAASAFAQLGVSAPDAGGESATETTSDNEGSVA